MAVEDEDEDGAQLLAALQADDALLEAATTVTVEQEAQAMAATRERAAEHGVEPKSHGEHGWAGSMRRKFELFLEKHGERLGYEAGVGPTVEHAKHFVDYCASGAGRLIFSPVGRVGMCDKYFEMHLPYTLAQRVFPMMGLPTWTGLSVSELREKAAPFKDGLLEHWKSVKVSRCDPTIAGASLHKERWDHPMYFLAQDWWLDSKQQNLAATTLAVMGFVCATCTRAGAMGRDWFDRKGLTQWWVGRNVLSVRDFTWDKFDFIIEVPYVSNVLAEEAATAARRGAGSSSEGGGAVEGAGATEEAAEAAEAAGLSEAEWGRFMTHVESALRGEVQNNRCKKHYHEVYLYNNSITPDAVQEVRRATSAMLLMQWRRGLFEVQYAGMSEEAIVAALRLRKGGYAGGMPPGAKISATDAFARWKAGERQYVHGRGEFLGEAEERVHEEPRLAEAANGGGGAATTAEVAQAGGASSSGEAALEAMAARQPIVRVRRRKRYELDVRDEPLFVEVDARTCRFAPREMNMETVGRLIARTGKYLGRRSHGDGLNSLRRLGLVTISKGCDDKGRGQTDAVRAAEHKNGTRTIERNYDDGTETTDNGCHHMGRPMKRMEGLRPASQMRLPALAEMLVFSDMAADDAVRKRVFDEAPERRLRRAALVKAQAADKVAQASLAKAVEQAAARGGTDDAVRQRRRVAEQVAQYLAKQKKLLANLENRLRHAAIEAKRAEMWEDRLAQFDRVTREELTALSMYRDRSGETLESLVVRFSGQETEGPVALRRRSAAVAATGRAAAGRRRGQGEEGAPAKRARRGKLVTLSLCLGESGEVMARVLPVADRRGRAKESADAQSASVAVRLHVVSK